MKKILIIIGLSFLVILVVLILSVLFLFKYGFANKKYVYFSKGTSVFKNWDEVFNNPSEAHVYTLNTGTMGGDRYGGLKIDAEDRYKRTDVPAFLISHKVHGDFLVDTGFDSSFSKNPPFGNYPFLIRSFLKKIGNTDITQEKGSDIASQLKKHNVQVKKVFFTHLHPDHTAGVPELNKNIEYYCDKNEIDFFVKAVQYGDHLKNIEILNLIDFDKAVKMPFFDKCIDVFGDGSFWAISTPGHTDGHVSYLVNSKPVPVLITGDAAFYYWGFKTLIGSDFDKNKIKAAKSRKALYDFINKYPKIKALLGHEVLRKD